MSDHGDISDIETRPNVSLASPELASERSSPPRIGERLGRYVVLEQIGDGGMGRVLRAYDPKLAREVALKLLLTNALGRDAQDRLVREARAMAMLSHPNVVAVYDVDDTESGVMLVMELVRGQTLRAWLRDAERPWPTIVSRFVEAGRGLAAAHAAGLLHRDFKPSNVLVPAQGAAKVTDFGLAKLDTASDSDVGEPRASSSSIRASFDGILTAVGEVVGTPRYMAPEQHAGEPLGPAVDQYAFCVALWEALSGRAPFEGRWKQLEAVKRKGPPPWPTTTVVPAWVVAALRRGLSVDPRERWPSMDALLVALTPVEPRSRWRVVVGAAAAVGLVAGWQVWIREQAPRCSGARAQLAGVWDEARRGEVLTAMGRVEASYATRVWEQTVAVLDAYAEGWVDMHTEACEATTVRGEQSAELMDLRMACLQHAMLELGAATAVLADADAEVVQRAHTLTAGLRPLSRCADLDALQADVAPPLPQEVEPVADVRARLAEAKALHLSGRYAAAQREVDAAKQQVATLEYGPVHTEVALLDALNLEQLGKLDAAEAAFHRVVALGARWRRLAAVQEASVHLMQLIGADQQRVAEGLQHRDLALGLAAGDPAAEAAVLTAVANILARQGDYDEAEAELRRALALQEGAKQEDALRFAMTRNNLANVLQRQGRYEEAEAEHRRVLALREQALGPDHPDVAMSRNNLANVLRREGRYAEAEAELRRALALQESALGPEHIDVAMTHNGLGNVLYAQGKHEAAEAELRRALAVLERALGPEHPDLLTVRTNLANTLFSRGAHGKAAAEYQRVLTAMEAKLGSDHPTTATLRANHAEALHALGEHARAEAELREALKQLDHALGPEHPDVAKLRSLLAAILAAQGEHEDAEAELRHALAQLERALGPEHVDVDLVRVRLAALLLDRDHPAEALELAERAWSRRDRPETPPAERAEAAFVLARALVATGSDERPRARALAERAVEGWVEAGEGHADDVEQARAWLREPAG